MTKIHFFHSVILNCWFQCNILTKTLKTQKRQILHLQLQGMFYYFQNKTVVRFIFDLTGTTIHGIIQIIQTLILPLNKHAKQRLPADRTQNQLFIIFIHMTDAYNIFALENFIVKPRKAMGNLHASGVQQQISPHTYKHLSILTNMHIHNTLLF